MAGEPETFTGSASEPGSPTLANVAALTEVTSASTPDGSGVVPLLDVPASEPLDDPAGTDDDLGEAEAGPPVVLMTTMVTMATSTRPTGMSADRNGCVF